MMLQAECIPCIIQVRYNELVNIIGSPRSVEYLGVILREFSDQILEGEHRNITVIATNLFRLVKKLTNTEDPYRQIKHRANMRGLEIYEKIKKVLRDENSTSRRLELAVRASLLGNAMDLGVAGYTPPSFGKLLEEIWSIKVVGMMNIGKLSALRDRTVLYLLDNAGEAALDRLLAEELVKMGAYVVGVVKTGAFQNDVTINEVPELGLNESFNEIIETGTDASSIFLNEISNELLKKLKEADVIIAKGMAHYEYLTDVEDRINKPIIYLLRAKCNPVARSLGVDKGDFVIQLSDKLI